MKTIINISAVTDYSGEPPIVTYSNEVTTVINQPTPDPVITERVWCSQCECDCCNCCGCCSDCN